MDLDLSNEYYSQLDAGTDSGSVTSSSHDTSYRNECDEDCEEELHHLELTHEAMRKNTAEKPRGKLGVRGGFNHIGREVANLEISLRFYVDLLGFAIIPRPPFHAEGYWLWGNGIALHLVLASSPKEKAIDNIATIHRLKECMPRVDHMCFLVDDIDTTKNLLDKMNMYYFEDYPLDDHSIHQIFFFDPDGHVIEASNCVPDIGKIACRVSF